MLAPETMSRPVMAYVAPFVIYVGLTMFESSAWLGLPYEAICTAKGIFAVAALWVFRSYYPAFSTAGFFTATLAGFVGVIVWIALDRLQAAIPGLNSLAGIVIGGNRVGFDPFAEGQPSAAVVAFIVVRLVELALVVPLAEEIFWRGFLARFLIADHFQSVPQGTFTAFTFSVVTIAFASVHPEILAAIAWGMMINVLYAKVKNIWACVIMHAATNALLGLYILITKSWHLW